MGIYSHKEHQQSARYKKAMLEKEKGAPVAKGWRTPHGFIDFIEPVTYDEACKEMEKICLQWADKLNLKTEKEENNGK